MQPLILRAIFRHMKDKKVIKSSQHAFMNISDLIAFHNEVTSLVG